MDLYARGDSRKVSSSEDGEGYENQSSPTTRINESELPLNLIRDKRYFTVETFEEIPSIPAPPLSDDTDRPFWAEDELSNSESRQRLNDRQKRRHSLSYRNRIAVHRSRSLLFQSSSSSSDASRVKILHSVRKREKYIKAAGRLGVAQLKARNCVSSKRTACPCDKENQNTRRANNKNISSGCQNSLSQTTQLNVGASSSKKLTECQRNNVSTSSSGNGSQKRSKERHVSKN